MGLVRAMTGLGRTPARALATRVWAPRSSVNRRIMMTGSAISTTHRRLLHPAVQSISLWTQPAPLRCALARDGCQMQRSHGQPIETSVEVPVRRPDHRIGSGGRCQIYRGFLREHGGSFGRRVCPPDTAAVPRR